MNGIRNLRALAGSVSGRIGPTALALVFLAGCAGQAGTADRTQVPITDVASLAGKWVGLLEVAAGRDQQDYVEVTIEGGGAYRLSAARTIGVMDAKGTVTVDGGRLVIKGESGGQGTGTLYTQPPSDPRLLIVNGTSSDGRKNTGRLRPGR